ncbi:unnamed protein product [Plutella xylostella]|uniref:palmitoyl-protein hydrolase n=1 Tax=Plutella xylostella TaxID=51655 RepID=A0A8S4GAN5_PLUXY|nr:unnamed protein product [Plutella xylostella]
MNGLSFSELCCLFCCPPCPGKIAAKLAFLPPEPTYAFTPDETGSKFSITLTERAEWQYSEREKENIEGFYSRTTRGNRIACLFVRCSPNARFTILFSHGNAVDLGQMSSFYLGLGTRINCNIFSYDYSGYGVSGGKPSEKNLYADIDAAWQALRTRYGISPENIILYGQSIGTVPTVDLAARYEVGAVVLHSPLMSGMRVAFPNTKRTWFFDAFPSIDKIPKVTSPVLVIHGTEDEVIDFSHGLAIYERCPRAVEPLWVEGAGHNDVELFNQYLERLKRPQNSKEPTKPTESSSENQKETISSATRSPRTTSHNISINITEVESPAGVRRRAHLRSLSDVTPAPPRSPRARSHSERPAPPASPPPRAARPRLRSDTLTILGDPWRKMSDSEVRAPRPARSVDDPWVKSSTLGGARRGKLERRSPVVCDACGHESCECWRPRTPRLDELRGAAAAAVGAGGEAVCTCPPRSPRPSPARLAAADRARSLSQQLVSRAPPPRPPRPPPPPRRPPPTRCSRPPAETRRGP